MQINADCDTKRLVIGCGTGRCGTISMMKFLNSMAGVSVTHEGVTGDDQTQHHLVSWYNGHAQLWEWLAELEKISGDARWYGDVGFYFLPYLPDIFERYPTSRAICLERNRKEVVKSYLKKTEGRNHWFPHNGTAWAQDPEWDPSYPSYAEPDKAKAIGLYWDHYHCMALEYSARFPDNFMLLPTSALNTADGRSRMLKFIGYDSTASIDGQFHFNATYRGRLTRSLERVSSVFARRDQP